MIKQFLFPLFMATVASTVVSSLTVPTIPKVSAASCSCSTDMDCTFFLSVQAASPGQGQDCLLAGGFQFTEWLNITVNRQGGGVSHTDTSCKKDHLWVASVSGSTCPSNSQWPPTPRSTPTCWNSNSSASHTNTVYMQRMSDADDGIMNVEVRTGSNGGGSYCGGLAATFYSSSQALCAACTNPGICSDVDMCR